MPRAAAATGPPHDLQGATELALTPGGRLVAVPAQGREESALTASVTSAAGQSGAALLLSLATLPGRPPLDTVPAFWRGFAERLLTALAHVPEEQETVDAPTPPPREALAELVQAAPPMRGGEYLDVAVLEALWSELDVHIRAQVAGHAGGLTGWLAQHAPLLNRVGRVCFHLAENKRDPDHPFAFLATYSPRISAGGRVQYQPLGRAIEEHAGARNKAVLVRLLSPVQRAADRLPWAAWLAFVLPFPVLGWLRRRRRASRGLCVRCGHPLLDAARCPECGHPARPAPD